jgi:hypothetical protein
MAIDTLEIDAASQIADSATNYVAPGDAPAKDAETPSPKANEETQEQDDVNNEEEPATSDSDDEHDGEDSADAPKKSKGVQKRIDELTRQRYEAERRAEQSRSEAEHYRKMAQDKPQEPAKDDKAPRFEDFNSYDDYVAAVAEHKATKKFEELTRKDQEKQTQQKQAEVVKNFNDKVTEARKKYDDFDTVALGNHVAYNDVTTSLVLASDASTELAYYLGKNPEIAQKLTQISPLEAAKEIGRIEAKLLEKPKPQSKQITNASPPIKPVGGKERLKKDPSQMSNAEYRAWRSKKK